MPKLPNVEFIYDLGGIPLHVEAIVHEDGDVEVECAWVEIRASDGGIDTNDVDFASLAYKGGDLEEILRDEAERQYNENEKERAHA